MRRASVTLSPGMSIDGVWPRKGAKEIKVSISCCSFRNLDNQRNPHLLMPWWLSMSLTICTILSVSGSSFSITSSKDHASCRLSCSCVQAERREKPWNVKLKRKIYVESNDETHLVGFPIIFILHQTTNANTLTLNQSTPMWLIYLFTFSTTFMYTHKITHWWENRW